MRRFWIATLAFFFCLSAIALSSQAENTNIKGDYVEVRTASVFAGACHYNGEVTTTGRDALMAWKVSAGRWNEVDLTGVRAIAVVSSEQNLSDAGARRRSEIIVDKSASYAQTVAMVAALKSRYSKELGEVISVTSAPVEFRHEGATYDISSASAAINVSAMPDDLCCRMPNLIWYEPMVPLQQRKVGYTIKASYSGNATGDSWQRSGENSAFYGSFAF